MYDPGAFPTATSVPGLGNETTLVFYSPLALSDISPTGFQSQILWGFLFPVQILQAGAWTLCFFGGTPMVVISLSFVSHCMGSGVRAGPD